MTYVFINIENPRRIKMIEAYSLPSAINKLIDRLKNEHKSGDATDYEFGYCM